MNTPLYTTGPYCSKIVLESTTHDHDDSLYKPWKQILCGTRLFSATDCFSLHKEYTSLTNKNLRGLIPLHHSTHELGAILCKPKEYLWGWWDILSCRLNAWFTSPPLTHGNILSQKNSHGPRSNSIAQAKLNAPEGSSFKNSRGLGFIFSQKENEELAASEGLFTFNFSVWLRSNQYSWWK